MNKFAFIVHPIEIQDFYSRFSMLQKAPNILADTIIEALPPFKLTTIRGVKTPEKEIEGFLIGVPISLPQIMEGSKTKILKKIIKACHLAEKLGAEFIGLGSYLSDIPGLESELIKNFHIPITTGKTFKILALIDAAKKAAAFHKQDFKEADIVILGADDSVGSLLSRRIAREAKYITLVSNGRNHLEELSSTILEETGTAVYISDKAQCSIERGEIIFVTDEQTRVLDWSKLRKDAILCDLSKFNLVSKEMDKERDDILYLDDGIIELPWSVETEVECKVELCQNKCFSALAGTILLVLNHHLEGFLLGEDPTIASMNSISKWAEEYAYKLVGISYIKKEIPIIE